MHSLNIRVSVFIEHLYREDMKNNNRNTYYNLFLYCISIAKKASLNLLLARLFIELFLPLIGVITIFNNKLIMDTLFITMTNTNNYEARRSLINLFVISFLLIFINLILTRLNNYFQLKHTELVNREFSKKHINISLSLDISYFEEPEELNRLLQVFDDEITLSKLLDYMLKCISLISLTIYSFTLLFRFAWYLPLLLIVAIIPSSIVSSLYTKESYLLSLKLTKDKRRLNYMSKLVQNKNFAADLRMNNKKQWFLQEYDRIWSPMFLKRLKLSRKKSFILFTLDLIPEIVVLSLVAFTVLKPVNGKSTIGDYTLLVSLLARFSTALQGLINTFLIIFDNKMRFNRLNEFKMKKNRITDGECFLDDKIHSISFEDVSFKYPNENQYVFRDLSFEMHEGDIIILDGQNGAGKSTIIKLILRFYDPTCGTIKINNRDIKEYKISSLRKYIAVYFQNLPNYATSLRKNFILSDVKTYSNMDNLDKTISAFFEITNCYFNNSSKISYDFEYTKLFSEKGLVLSDGESQKLALSRILSKNHSVLILDEPFSNLDSESTQKISDYICSESTNKITIIVAHNYEKKWISTFKTINI